MIWIKRILFTTVVLGVAFSAIWYLPDSTVLVLLIIGILADTLTNHSIFAGLKRYLEKSD